MADLTRTIELKPLALHIGAEISGVDLGRPLDVATRKSINDALLRWKVVFFRGQRLDQLPEGQILVHVGAQRARTHACEYFAKRRIAREIRAEH